MVNEIKLLGTGACVPKYVVTNEDLTAFLETSDEWIFSRSGIHRRHVAADENLTDLCVKAGERAMVQAGILASDIDLLIVATLTPDAPLPCEAARVQEQLGAVNATCFDLSAACSGFLFALQTAAMYIRGGAARHALIIGGEVLSKILDWQDRTTCILFGDGAGAAVLGCSEEKGYIDAVTGSDGTRGHVLTCGGRGLVHPFRTSPDDSRCGNLKEYVEMDGQAVFKFAITTVPGAIRELLSRQGLEALDIQHYVLHQANARIIQSVARRLKVPEERFIMNMEEYGNTSAASIPIALDELMRSGRVKKGDRIMLAGFGGGLTWGAALLQI